MIVPLSVWEICLRLMLAAILGAVIGFEREHKGNTSVGMRTHMMVSVGAALTILVSAYGFNDILGEKGISLDPSRIAAQVISGIGFLGAGAILRFQEGFIRGLTTASGIWTVAAIGLACGSGLYFPAIATTVLALIILYALFPLEKKLHTKTRYKTLKIITTDKTSVPNIIQDVLAMEKIISEPTFSVEHSETVSELKISFITKENLQVNQIYSVLSEKYSIKNFSCTINW